MKNVTITDDWTSPADGALPVATAGEKRMWQVTLCLLALSLTFHWPHQVARSCSVSEGIGKCESYSIPGKKERQ